MTKKVGKKIQYTERMLLDIVAKSLYSGGGPMDLTTDRVHNISIIPDKVLRTLTIQDTGVGMTR